MLVFLIYPFCTLITRSFFSTKVDGFTFENYIRFFTKKYYYSALGRSIFVSVVTTVTTLIVGVPIAGYVVPDAFEKNLMVALLGECGLSQERIRLQDAHASAAPPS